MNFTDTIVTCDCGQKNRLPVVLPPGKAVICGACKLQLDLIDLDDLDLDDVDDDDADGGL